MFQKLQQMADTAAQLPHVANVLWGLDHTKNDVYFSVTFYDGTHQEYTLTENDMLKLDCQFLLDFWLKQKLHPSYILG